MKIFKIFLVSFILFTFFSGCSSNTRTETEVSGRIVLDDQPIEYGYIVFEPYEETGQDGGGRIENGRYLAKVPPGRKLIRIRGLRQSGFGPPPEWNPNGEKVPMHKQVTSDAMHWKGSEYVIEVGAKAVALDLGLKSDSVLKNDSSDP